MGLRNRFYVTAIILAMLGSSGPNVLGQTMASHSNSRPQQLQTLSPLSPAEQEVRKLEREWLDAYEQHDSVAMDRILADDFKLTQSGGGRQSKADIMAALRAARDAGRARPKFSTEDVQSRVSGDAVVLTGRFVQRMERDGQTMTMAERYADIYQKRGGRWQVVTSQLTPDLPPIQSRRTDAEIAKETAAYLEQADKEDSFSGAALKLKDADRHSPFVCKRCSRF